MSRVVTFANKKGGCGKTTTAVNIAHALAMKKNKVLLLDMDAQAHSSISLGCRIHEPDFVHFLRGGCELYDAIQMCVDGLSLIPFSKGLAEFELELSMLKGSQTILLEKLSPYINEFDYLIFDFPRSEFLALSVLAASREVYIPMQMHFLMMESLAEMMRLIYTVNANWNPELRMKGIIPTFFNKHMRISRELSDEIARTFGADKLFPPIRMNISLAEAPGYGKTIFQYAPKSIGASDYIKLAERISG